MWVFCMCACDSVCVCANLNRRYGRGMADIVVYGERCVIRLPAAAVKSITIEMEKLKVTK